MRRQPSREVQGGLAALGEGPTRRAPHSHNAGSIKMLVKLPLMHGHSQTILHNSRTASISVRTCMSHKSVGRDSPWTHMGQRRQSSM